LGYTATRIKGGAHIGATGADAQKLFDMMTSKTPPFGPAPVVDQVDATDAGVPLMAASVTRTNTLMELVMSSDRTGA
jgi:hypothetical protein